MRTVILSLALLMLLVPTPCAGQECQTSEADFWLCAGDQAWTTGYLVPPDVLDLRDCQVWETQAALIPELRAERDTFQDQRDQALLEADLIRADLIASLAFGDGEAERAARFEAELADSFSVLDVALIAGGTGVAALVVGVLIGGLAF